MTTEKKERDAGTALDVEVATLVMGESLSWWDVADANGSRKGLRMEDGREPTRDEAERYCKLPHFAGRGFVPVPVVDPYSSEIASAFLVVEAMRAKGWRFSLIVHPMVHGPGVVDVEFELDDDEATISVPEWHAETIPLGICRCALAALAASSATSAVSETPISPASL